MTKNATPSAAAFVVKTPMLELLSEEELQRLTCYKRGYKQLEWLTEMGIKGLMGRDGIPLVLRSHVEAVLSPIVTPDKSKGAQPDFEALRLKLRRKSNAKHAKAGKQMAP